MTREFLNPTQERFLKGILAQLPIARIAEVHLFPPMKQGGVESGVAVIAAYPEKVLAPDSPTPDSPTPDAVPDDAGAGAELGVIEATSTSATEVSEEFEAGSEELQAPNSEPLTVPDVEVPIDPIADAEQVARLDDAGTGAELGNIDEDPTSASEVSEGLEAGSESEVPAVPDPGADPANPRYTVYTAHYRLVLKGLDRGKWEMSVVDEADAPLLTVETVVRGVQHRAGDVEPPHRYDASAIRALLRITDEQPQDAGAAAAP